MLFKMKFALCMIAMATAFHAQAQEASNQAGKAQSPPSASQGDKSRNESRTGENQNRRGNDATDAKSQNRNQNRTETSNEDRSTRTDTNVRRTETEHARGASSDKPLDSKLAGCLLLGNQKEVAISQFAAERAKHEKVKEFARQMVKDHTQAITMLQRFAGPDASKELSISSESSRGQRSETTVNRSTASTDAKSTDANRASAEGEQKEANRTENAGADRTRSETTVQVRSEHEAIPDKMAAIEREAAQKCIAMAKQELEQSSNFDQAYVGMQISAHMGMVAHLETYKSYASQDLGKAIQEQLDTAQNHLRHAKELVMEISRDSDNRSSTNSSDSSKSDAKSRSDSSSRSDANRNSATGRDTNRNPANRTDSESRREGATDKKDAPKS